MYAESNGGNFCTKRRFSTPVEDLLGSAGCGGGVAISALVEPQAGLLPFLFLIEGTRPFTVVGGMSLKKTRNLDAEQNLHFSMQLSQKSVTGSP